MQNPMNEPYGWAPLVCRRRNHESFPTPRSDGRVGSWIGLQLSEGADFADLTDRVAQMSDPVTGQR